jgi:hypothetical protein
MLAAAGHKEQQLAATPTADASPGACAGKKRAKLIAIGNERRKTHLSMASQWRKMVKHRKK